MEMTKVPELSCLVVQGAKAREGMSGGRQVIGVQAK